MQYTLKLNLPVNKIKESNQTHDRFVIIDDKDLGKKYFGFSKMDTGIVEMLKAL
jgi:hypothetical protein